MKRVFLLAVTVTSLVGLSYGAEYFTEGFPYYSAFDLEGISLTFTPDGSADYYSATAIPINELPVPFAGQHVVSIADDGYGYVDLTQSFIFYGASYNKVSISANGHLTFNTQSTDWTPSLEEHFATPRIATLWMDLNSDSDNNGGGSVMYQLLGDRFVVSFDRVWEFGTVSGNRLSCTFQTELFYDGRIRMSWLNIDNPNPGVVVGLSDGSGYPSGFTQSDLSSFTFDVDSDGIWDEWEVYYFSHYTNCLPTANFDGDTLDNLSEYICGSDPLDPNSYFFCVTDNTPAGPVVAWPIMEGRTYTVLKTTALGTTPFTPYQSGFEFPNNAFTDTVSSVSGFYKVEVELTD